MDTTNNNTKANNENTSECFRDLNAEDLAIVNEKRKQVTFFKDETIFKQGAFAPHVLFISKGLVRVYLQTDRNKQINIRLAKSGDILAFSSVFKRNTYLYSAVALKDSCVCMVDKEALTKLLIKNSEFSMKVSSKNSHNETRYIDIIQNISYKQMRGKLASALLYLSSNDFQNENVYEYLTRQNIADFASISVESAVKFLKEFEKEKIITLKGKNIIIKNNEKLNELNLHG